MPRFSTFPKIIEECRTLNLKKLKEWGYLKPGFHSGSISWSNYNNVIHSKIGIKSFISKNESYVELDYITNEKKINYKIDLITIESNLGKGKIWYFECPHTKKFCRKLYLHGGYFFHRTAFKGLYYEQQTQSKNTRDLISQLKKAYPPEEVYREFYDKKLRRCYKGNPTKKFLKLKRIIEIADRTLDISDPLIF